LDTLFLLGNPVVNANPGLAKIEGNRDLVKKALNSYFGGSGGLSGFSQLSLGQINCSNSNLSAGSGIGGFQTGASSGISNHATYGGSLSSNNL